ncbi:hypothetical protein DFA_02865 [Cavenderia fasciculata]|uniref:Ankyrin repeat-containing protein n=1 Tax=Cavenderia fasciculata TaxID=261658 RepID=F4PIP1_CACFS|nr:uncharacterized protein DFA_02865 [Cavenderia fasciculata]EGG24621.1 hypothetical protein DFA_02865 [Cavenderia fasciculata]|eukprot:XP_004362472.1 hypothetical protein DFA_02865 [Cavenderia fasciculata]
MNKQINSNNNNNDSINQVFKNRYLLQRILRLVQHNHRRQLVRSYRYNELNYLLWILENDHQGLLKMIFDRGEFEQRLKVQSDGIELFFTKVKDRQLLLSIYNQYPHLFYNTNTIKWACLRGDVEIVKMLINQTEPSKLSFRPNDMLDCAVQSGSVEMVQFIVDFISSIKTRERKAITLIVKTANLEIINIVVTSKQLAGINEHILIDVDLLLGMDGPWPVYFNRDICRWRPEISDTLVLIAKELLAAADSSTNPSECSKHLSKSSIPFKTIYKSIKSYHQFVGLAKMKKQMETIRDTDPVYYPMLIIKSFGNEEAKDALVTYLIKSDHFFLKLSLCDEDREFWGHTLGIPPNLCDITVDHAEIFYVYPWIVPTSRVDNIELFDYIDNSCIAEGRRMEWVSRVLEYAILKLNYNLIRHISTTIKDLDKQLPKWSFGLGKGSFISDYIEMAKLLTELNLYANEINFDCAIRSIQHPIDHLTNYQLTCLSLAPYNYSLYFAFFCNGDYMIKALINQNKDGRIKMSSIIRDSSISGHIVRYQEDVIRSILNGEYGDNIDWNWDGLSNLFESSCIVGKLELFEYFLVIVEKMFGKKKTSQICSMVVESGRIPFIKYIIKTYNTTIMDLLTAIGQSKHIQSFLKDQTQVDSNGIVTLKLQ